MRSLVRVLFAITAVIGFAWMVGNTPHLLIALLAVVLAVLAVRTWYRNLEPLYVPVPPAAFPDPLQEAGLSSGAERVERPAHPWVSV